MFQKLMMILLSLSILIFTVSCSDDDDPTSPSQPTPTTFQVSIENTSQGFGIMSSGVFNTPVGASSPGPIVSGGAYEFSFNAAPGNKLSLASMFVQSNDLFYSPGEAGIELFDASGNPRTGDFTSELPLWDAGTEANEPPGAGLHQAPRQPAADNGAADPDNTVRLVNDGYTYPDVTNAIRFTLTSNSPTEFTGRLEVVAPVKDFIASGAFATPVGASGPGPIGPGGAYEFSFNAAPGYKLSFANMFVPSNDFFFAPDENGIDLFDASGNQITGDITGQIELWDAGTEINQEPGLGEDQVQRQSAANTGAADPDNTVRLAPDDFNNLPAVSDVIRVTLTATSATGFTARIENVSTATTLSTSDGGTQAVPMSPGVWAIHTNTSPLFTPGQPDFGDGLEAISEDGNVSGLNTVLAGNTGVNVVLAPGVWTVHNADAPLFTVGQADRSEGLEGLAEDGTPGNLNTALTNMAGLPATPFAPGVWVIHTTDAPFFDTDQPDRGEGLEALAEDGDPSGLAAAVANRDGVSSSGIFNTPSGASGPGPIIAGGRYEFTIEALPGDKLNFATMFVQSNDIFIGPNEQGIALFNNTTPVSGDFTAQAVYWDAGTEVNEEPGIGLSQAPRQSGPDTGPVENGIVTLGPNDNFTYPLESDVIRVTITPQ